MAKKSKLAVNLLLLFLSCLLALGAVELLLRAYGIEGSGARVATRLKINEFDPELGWWPRAAQAYYRSDAYYGHFNYYNAARMPVAKGQERSRPDPDTPTIAFLGDSYVEGYYLPYEKTFVDLVDRAFPDHQVINLGVSGYNPAQYLLRARRDLPAYKVVQVVVGFFPYNDVPAIDEPTMQGYARPVFGEDLDRPVNLPLEIKRGAENKVSTLRWLARQSAAYSVLRPYVKKLQRLIAPDPAEPPDEERLTPAPADYAKALGLIAAIAEVAPEADLTVAYIPFYEQLMAPEKLARDLALFHRNCEALALACAAPSFLEDPPESFDALYIGPQAAEGHFSEQGARLYADFLIDLLRPKLVTGN